MRPPISFGSRFSNRARVPAVSTRSEEGRGAGASETACRERFGDRAVIPRLQEGIEGGFAGPPQETAVDSHSCTVEFDERAAEGSAAQTLSLGPNVRLSPRTTERSSPFRGARLAGRGHLST